MIIAGYEEDLQENFFGTNPGLNRRFGWYFTIHPYSADDLYNIFLRQLKQNKWTCEPSVHTLFVKHFDKFKNAGGDTDNIAFKSKLEYCKDNWNKNKQSRRLKYEHIEKVLSIQSSLSRLVLRIYTPLRQSGFYSNQVFSIQSSLSRLVLKFHTPLRLCSYSN